jgi:beta-glucosidase
MSYTHFRYTKAHLASDAIKAGEDATVEVHVANTGKMDGDEVVEVYVTPPQVDGAPLLSLVGFQRIHLRVGESTDVAVTVPARQLSVVAANGTRHVLQGRYAVYVGGGQPPVRGAGMVLNITATKALPESVP